MKFPRKLAITSDASLPLGNIIAYKQSIIFILWVSIKFAEVPIIFVALLGIKINYYKLIEYYSIKSIAT
jgi:hypothetical protein